MEETIKLNNMKSIIEFTKAFKKDMNNETFKDKAFRKALRKPSEVEFYQAEDIFYVETDNSSITAKKGDYVIRDEDGEYIVCAKEKFESNYSPVE